MLTPDLSRPILLNEGGGPFHSGLNPHLKETTLLLYSPRGLGRSQVMLTQQKYMAMNLNEEPLPNSWWTQIPTMMSTRGSRIKKYTQWVWVKHRTSNGSLVNGNKD